MEIAPAPPSAIYSNDYYEILIANNPVLQGLKCYGVKNIQTGVIEAYPAYPTNLPLAIHIADEFGLDMEFGIDRVRGDDSDTPTGSQQASDQPGFTWTN